MQGIRTRGAVALACLLLAACGGGGGGDNGGNGGGTPSAGADYFPVPAQARWIYAADDGSLARVDVVGAVATPKGQGVSLVTSDASGSLVDRTVAYADASGVTQFPPSGVSGFEQDVGPLKLLAFPARAGQSFTQIDRTFAPDFFMDLDGKPDRVAVKAVVTVVGFEDVDVPAGHFAAALHVRTDSTETFTPSSGRTPPSTYHVVVDDWYGAGVGLLRTTEVDQVVGDPPGVPATRSLTAYHVGNARSETQAPTVTATAPGTTARASGADVSVTFDEAVDADTLAVGWQITDPDGHAVPGHVTLVGDTAHFVPDAGWANGTYTATLTTAVTDLVGNPLAQAITWHFALDAIAPTVLSTTPAEASYDLPSTAPVVIQFSEPIAPASVNPGTVWVNDGMNMVPVTTQVAGATLTLTPTPGWPRQIDVHVAVSGLTDVAGNPMTDGFNLSFHTDAGQFDWPQAIAAADTNSVTIADLDGDGHNDLLYTVLTTGQVGAFVRYGRADGTLDAPVPIAAGDVNTCWQMSGLLVVDLDGDGRKDVVEGGGYCGWRVLRQSAPRTFTVAEQVNFVVSGLQVADIDGDGQLEVVGLSTGFSPSLWVWHQDANHRFPATATSKIPLPADIGTGLHVADLDNDNRPDLVISGAYVYEDAAVLMQQTDGSFARTQSLLTGEGAARGIAIGDVDGDGRPDLVMTAGGNKPVYVAVFHQRADHSFGTPEQLPCLDIPGAIALTDIDGDGRPDIVVTHMGWGHVSTFLQRPDGTLGAESLFVTGYGSGDQQQLAVGDLTGDGHPDLVVDGQILRQRTPDSGPAAQAAAAGFSHAHALRASHAKARRAAHPPERFLGAAVRRAGGAS